MIKDNNYKKCKKHFFKILKDHIMGKETKELFTVQQLSSNNIRVRDILFGEFYKIQLFQEIRLGDNVAVSIYEKKIDDYYEEYEELICVNLVSKKRLYILGHEEFLKDFNFKNIKEILKREGTGCY